MAVDWSQFTPVAVKGGTTPTQPSVSAAPVDPSASVDWSQFAPVQPFGNGNAPPGSIRVPVSAPKAGLTLADVVDAIKHPTATKWGTLSDTASALGHQFVGGVGDVLDNAASLAERAIGSDAHLAPPVAGAELLGSLAKDYAGKQPDQLSGIGPQVAGSVARFVPQLAPILVAPEADVPTAAELAPGIAARLAEKSPLLGKLFEAIAGAPLRAAGALPKAVAMTGVQAGGQPEQSPGDFARSVAENAAAFGVPGGVTNSRIANAGIGAAGGVGVNEALSRLNGQAPSLASDIAMGLMGATGGAVHARPGSEPVRAADTAAPTRPIEPTKPGESAKTAETPVKPTPPQTAQEAAQAAPVEAATNANPATAGEPGPQRSAIPPNLPAEHLAGVSPGDRLALSAMYARDDATAEGLLKAAKSTGAHQSTIDAVKDARRNVPEPMNPADVQDNAMQAVLEGRQPGTPSHAWGPLQTADVGLAGGANDTLTGGYLDRNVPRTVEVDGKTIQTEPAIRLHENVESHLMHELGFGYQTAHAVAQARENAFIRSEYGVDPDKYQAALTKGINEARNGAPGGDVPADLDAKPYADSGTEHLLPPDHEAAPAQAAAGRADAYFSQLPKEIGWDQRGGNVIRGVGTASEGNEFARHADEGEVVGRTKWIPKPSATGEGYSEFWRMRPDARLTEAQAHEAFRKAAAGEKLRPIEQRFIDYAHQTAQEYAQTEAQAFADHARAQQELSDAERSDDVQALREQNAALGAGNDAEDLTVAQWARRAREAGMTPDDVARAVGEGSTGERIARLARAIQERTGHGEGQVPRARQSDVQAARPGQDVERLPEGGRPEGAAQPRLPRAEAAGELGAASGAPVEPSGEAVRSNDAAAGGVAADRGAGVRAEAGQRAAEGDQAATVGPNTDTGIKNAQTKAEREARGLDEINVQGRRHFGEVWDRASAALKDDPHAGRTLADAIAAKPRPLSAEESAILIQDRARIQNARRAAERDAAEAIQHGDTVSEAEARIRMADADQQLEVNDKAARASGYEQGLGLAMRRAMAREDYSLAAMKNRMQAKLGRKLNDRERAQIEDLHRQLQEKDDQIAALQAKGARRKPVAPKAAKTAEQRFADLAERLRKLHERETAMASEGDVHEVAESDLSPEDRELVRQVRERAASATDNHAASDQLQQESVARGEREAGELGLRGAVVEALGPERMQSVHFVHDEDGLPADVRARGTPIKRGNVRYGLHTPDGHSYIFTKTANTPERATWTAIHEVGGHGGVQAIVNAHPDVKVGSRTVRDAYESARKLFLQNPTVRKLASVIAKQRGSKDMPRMAEEAMAELQAATRTGRWDEIVNKYGVEVPKGVRDGVKSAMANFVRRLKAIVRAIHAKLTGKHNAFTDADVHDMLDRMWEAARGEHAGAGEQADQQVFHGTPHRGIEKEGFKLNKIGTGEGAQAYGWGVYFAGRRAIAEGYRERLSGHHLRTIELHGKPLDTYSMLAIRLRNIDAMMRDDHKSFKDAKRDELDDLRFRAVRARDDHNEAAATESDETARQLNNIGEHDWKAPEGQLYHAEIPEDKDLLDWDKPLSEQSPKVRAKLEAIGKELPDWAHEQLAEHANADWSDLTGREAYQFLSRLASEGELPRQHELTTDNGHPAQAASEFLNAHGIPGLRYLDGGSRRPNIADKALVRAMEAHPGDREAALDAAMRGIHGSPAEKARTRKDYSALMDRLERRHNYVIWDEAHLNNDVTPYYSEEPAQVEPEAKRIIRGMAQELVNAGYADANDIVDRIHDTIREHTPLSKDELADVISGYGHKPKPTRDMLRTRMNALRAELRQASKQRDIASGKVPGPDAVRNRTRQKQLAQQIEELKARIASGDFDSREKAMPPAYTAETNRLTIERNQLRRKFDRLAEQASYKASGKTNKIVSTALAFRRAVLLSSVRTIGKLTAASAYRIGLQPIEHAVQGTLGLVPGIRGIAKRAPLEGRFSPGAEWEALRKTFSRETGSEMLRKLMHGEGSYDIQFGKQQHSSLHPLLSMVAHVHAFLHTPAEHNEYVRATRMLTDAEVKRAIQSGMTPEQAMEHMADPMTQGMINMRAYEASQRAIFFNKNFIVSGFHALQGALRNAGAEGSTERAFGRGAANTLEYMFPIVKVPSNFAGEVASYGLGAAKAAMQLIAAKGVKHLTPEQADYIMRNLGKQTLGAIVAAIGWFGYTQIGSFYQVNDNKRRNIPEEGSAWGIPKWAIDTPVGMMLTIGATMHRISDGIPKRSGGFVKGTGTIGEGVRAAAVGTAEEVPFFNEFGHLSDSFQSNRSMGVNAGKQASDFVIPPDVRRLAANMDNHTPRKPGTFLQALEMSIPGLRQHVPVNTRR